MKNILAVVMLFAASTLVAAPVSVSFERNGYSWEIGNTWDTTPCGFSPIAAVGLLDQEYCVQPPGQEITLQGGAYSVDTFEYQPGLGESGTVGWNYASEALSADDSFSLLASNLVYAAHTVPLANPELYAYFDPARPRITQFFYWTEFVVTEDVLYTGSRALTDGQLLNGGCAPPASYSSNQEHCYDEQLKYSSSGNVYTQGSILRPGTYQYWQLGGFEQIALHADYGETLTAAVHEDYAFTFTTVVPIPAAVWLFGSGLGLLGWMTKWSSKHK